MVRKKILNLILLTCVVLALSSCTQTRVSCKEYSGDPLPSTEIATVEIDDRLFVLHVDGELVDKGFGESVGSVELLPGKHTFRAYYNEMGTEKTIGGPKIKKAWLPALEINLLAGRCYKLYPLVRQEGREQYGSLAIKEISSDSSEIN